MPCRLRPLVSAAAPAAAPAVQRAGAAQQDGNKESVSSPEKDKALKLLIQFYKLKRECVEMQVDIMHAQDSMPKWTMQREPTPGVAGRRMNGAYRRRRRSRSLSFLKKTWNGALLLEISLPSRRLSSLFLLL